MCYHISKVYSTQSINCGKKILGVALDCDVFSPSLPVTLRMKNWKRTGFLASAVTQAHPDELRYPVSLQGIYKMKTWVWSLKFSSAFRLRTSPGLVYCIRIQPGVGAVRKVPRNCLLLFSKEMANITPTEPFQAASCQCCDGLLHWGLSLGCLWWPKRTLEWGQEV